MKIVPTLPVVLALVLLNSSCATLLVRTDATDRNEHVYPATVVDAEGIWDCGVKGQHPMVIENPKARMNPFARTAFGLAFLIDMPFSIISDTVMLGPDVYRLYIAKPGAEDGSHNKEP